MLFADLPADQLPEGVVLFSGALSKAEQETLVATARAVAGEAPFLKPRMRDGTPFSVRMTNCGTWGWISDENGYAYVRRHPLSQKPWPALPKPFLMTAWKAAAKAGHAGFVPDAALVNFYGPGDKLGLHQDATEQDKTQPIISVSLGDEAVFELGGLRRDEPTRALTLKSGDVLVMGGPGRMLFHGIREIRPGTSDLLKTPGRINITLRRHMPAD